MLPAALRPGDEAQRERAREAARALEAMVLKQLVQSSKAFQGGDTAGAGIREELFASTLAEALVKGGGIGLAAQVERSIYGEAPPARPAAPAPSAAPALPAPAAAALPGDGTLTSGFGLRADPFTGRQAMHRGIDLAAPEGSPVRAALPGVVRSAGERGGYGLAVEVEHEGGFTTLYAHASELLVKEGERVTPGQTIARVGRTGRSTGAHLHLEVRKNSQAVDPMRALNLYGRRVEEPAGSGS
ncbi:MAG: M23 family metallopeptidase [Deltaproteobacteria bacterium]|nr:M23 family metallopeptidase [Deltaproteobacteria bacterium]